MKSFEKFIDKYVGTFIIIFLYPLFLLKSFFFKAKGKKILIIRLGAMGETILTLPMIKELKKEYDVDIIASYKNKFIFDNLGWDYSLLSPKLIFKILKYDYAFDLEPFANLSAILSFFLAKENIGFNPLFRAIIYKHKIPYNDKQHVVFTYCDLLKAVGKKCKPSKLLPLNKKNFIFKEKSKFHIGVHAGTSVTAPWRRWKEEKFANLIKKILSKYDAYIYLTGTKNEERINERIIKMIGSSRVINVAGKYNFNEFVSFVSALDLFISNDTGPMHIAAAQGVKTIGLFGPNLPSRFGPFPLEKNAFLYHKISCSPCINVHLGEFKKCPSNGKCMDLITEEEVFKKAEAFLNL